GRGEHLGARRLREMGRRRRAGRALPLRGRAPLRRRHRHRRPASALL
ncbi:MAG: hypothetical protein AVDCRST_MAG19-3632, partial [uncultured Thermomicrobiales bacterium]